MRYWHWPNGSGLGGSGLVVRKEFMWSGNPDVSCWALFFPSLCAVEGGQGLRIFMAFYISNFPSVAVV